MDINHILMRHRRPNVTLISTYKVVDSGHPKDAGTNTNANHLYAFYIKQGRHNPHKLQKHHSDDLVKYMSKRVRHKATPFWLQEISTK
jgi:hypothetical protein